MTNVYLDLTDEFNDGALRAVICSGQAVVLHRIALMSKDGDWILLEDPAALEQVIRVLGKRGAVYRYGAPLDLRWLRGGWSSHFEFQAHGIRVRTDFFTRPPRLTVEDLERLWIEQASQRPPFTGARDLIAMKRTRREKDYPVIGELARLLTDPADQLRFSRSARDLVQLCAAHPGLAARLAAERPLLDIARTVGADPDDVAEALDAERRRFMKEDENRLAVYEHSARAWHERWPEVRRRIAGLPLADAHAIVVEEAEQWLPMTPTASE